MATLRMCRSPNARCLLVPLAAVALLALGGCVAYPAYGPGYAGGYYGSAYSSGYGYAPGYAYAYAPPVITGDVILGGGGWYGGGYGYNGGGYGYGGAGLGTVLVIVLILLLLGII